MNHKEQPEPPRVKMRWAQRGDYGTLVLIAEDGAESSPRDAISAIVEMYIDKYEAAPHLCARPAILELDTDPEPQATLEAIHAKLKRMYSEAIDKYDRYSNYTNEVERLQAENALGKSVGIDEATDVIVDALEKLKGQPE